MKLKGKEHIIPCKRIFCPGVKRLKDSFLKVIMMHIKLKGMELSTYASTHSVLKHSLNPWGLDQILYVAMLHIVKLMERRLDKLRSKTQNL